MAWSRSKTWRRREIEAFSRGVVTIDEGRRRHVARLNDVASRSTLCANLRPSSRDGVGPTMFDGRAICGLSLAPIVKPRRTVPEAARLSGLTVRENITLGASNGNASSAAIGVKQMLCSMSCRYRGIPRDAPLGRSGWRSAAMVAVARGLMARRASTVAAGLQPRLALGAVIVQAVFFDTIAEIHSRGRECLLVEQNAHMASKNENWATRL